MDKKVKIEYSRYPTNGIILDFILKGLGIKHKDTNFRKIYNRFLKEENISVDEYYDTQNTIISDILSEFKIDSKDTIFFEHFTKGFLLYFNTLKTINETQEYSQKQLDFIIVAETLIPISTILLQSDKKLRIPNIVPTYKTGSIQMLLQIVQSDFIDKNKDIKILLENILNKKSYKGYDTINKNINNWIEGKVIPNLQHIELIATLSESTKNFKNAELNNYLQVAKIMQFLYDKSIGYFGVELTDLLIEYFLFFIESIPLLLNSLNYNSYTERIFDLYPYNKQDYKKIDTQTFTCYIDTVSSIVNYKDKDIFRDLYNNHEKSSTDNMPFQLMYIKSILSKIKSSKLEKEFLCDIEKITSLYDVESDPYFSFFYARYWAQKREYKKATELYLTALNYGKNCMGKDIRSIIKEGLIVSAQETRKKQINLINAKSSFTKFYKEAYFYKLIDDLPREISQYFLIDMTKQFDIYFTNLFPDTYKSTEKILTSNIMAKDMDSIKIDYKNPNRLITKNMPNPISQLMYCANKEDFNCVKKLIENGADVDFLKINDNATALIVALQAIEDHSIHKNKNNNELLKIVKILIKNMSQNMLNATLTKKQESALSLAIRLGLVAIVHLLIDHGLDIESQRLTLDRATPLVLSIMCIKLSKQTSIDVQLPVFKEDRIKLAKAINIFGNAIYTEELDEQLKRVISKLSKKSAINPYKNNQEDRYKIFDLILHHTKDIDFVDKYNKTALIYSKEIGEEYLVEEILKRK